MYTFPTCQNRKCVECGHGGHGGSQVTPKFTLWVLREIVHTNKYFLPFACKASLNISPRTDPIKNISTWRLKIII